MTPIRVSNVYGLNPFQHSAVESSPRRFFFPGSKNFCISHPVDVNPIKANGCFLFIRIRISIIRSFMLLYRLEFNSIAFRVTTFRLAFVQQTKRSASPECPFRPVVGTIFLRLTAVTVWWNGKCMSLRPS